MQLYNSYQTSGQTAEPKPGQTIRPLFPFFRHNPDTVFLDSAATSLKPQSVIHAMLEYFEANSVNIHRGVYALSVKATEVYEQARQTIAEFVGAPSGSEVIYTRGTTEAINLLAYSLLKVRDELKDFFSAWQTGLGQGDVILISESEHHSNIVPWQMLASMTSAKVLFLPVKADGSLDYSPIYPKGSYHEAPVKVISLAGISNVSGVIHDLEPARAFAREKGAIFIIDGAQAVTHARFSLKNSGADFIAFSAHKMCGPTGIGALVGSRDVLSVMPPFMGGGDMIETVTTSGTTFNVPPYRFEAGTPAIGEVYGFAAAIRFLEQVGMAAIEEHERKLTLSALEMLQREQAIIYGPSLAQVQSGAIRKAGVLAFSLPGIHPHDIGTLLDELGIAIRTGHHCCQPLMSAWGIPAAARASLYLYNTEEDIEKLADGLRFVRKMFKKP